MSLQTRGYFGVGVEGLSKPGNAGNLFRTAHAFGASFVFTANAEYSVRKARSDTSSAPRNIPWYDFDTTADINLPKGCQLVGVELLDDAVDLPVFRHPLNAAYVLGRERGSLSAGLVARCDHIIKIPTSFCLNIATAGAIVIYDRVVTLGKFGTRPVGALSDAEAHPEHVHGRPIDRAARHQARLENGWQEKGEAENEGREGSENG